MYSFLIKFNSFFQNLFIS